MHGRLVLKDTGKPVSGALVRLRTWDEAFDCPETIALLGGASAVAELRREGRFEDALRAVGGWRVAFAGRSGEDGAFSIRVPPDFPQFRFEVEADFAFLGEGTERWYAPGSPEAEAGIALRLESGGKIEGTIRSVAGSPLAGARVSIDPSGRGRDRQVDAESSGRFAAGGLRPGRYGVSALGPGCAPAWREKVEVRGGEATSVSLDLPPEGFVSGRAVDEEGRGVPRARIDAKSQESVGPNPYAIGYGRAYADAEGNFRVGSLRPGKHTVTASRPGRLAAKGETVEVAAGFGVPDLKLVLAGGRALAGRVLDGTGAPVAEAEVTARTDRAAQRSRGLTRSRTWSAQSAVTAADGSFRLGGLDDGPFVVVASSKERGRTERKEVPAGDEALELVLEPATTLAGKVRDAETGEPVLRFDVELERRDPSRGANYREGQGSKTFATKDGLFEWTDRKPGTYRVLVAAQGYVSEDVDGIEAAAGERKGGIEVALKRGASIRGRVLDRATGEPVADVSISAEPVEVDEELERSRRRKSGDPTGPDGAFETAGLIPGKWRLRAWREGFVSARTDPIQVEDRGTVDGIEILLPRGGSVEGVAAGPDGAPYSGGRAWATRIERSEEGEEIRVLSGFGYTGRGSSQGAEIDASGAFRIESLETGRYLVQARPAPVPGEPREEAERRTLRGFVEVQEGALARVDFARPGGGCLVRGRVARDREGVEGVEVTLVPKEWPKDREARSLLEPRLRTRTLAGGAFEIADAPPGEATVGARMGAGASVSEKVVVPAGGELTVDLRLPLGEIAGRVVSEVDGSPIPRAAVAAYRLPKEGAEGGGAWTNATAGEDGRYRIRDLAPGAYRVRASPGFPAARDEKATNLASDERGPVDVGDAGATVVDFALPVGAKVLVEVRGSDGRAVANASVRLKTENKPGREPSG
ncbi:MAG TPA: carboxypeptidase-like regulatory domain-containing protein, partial [Planctomycetota bacterium]|nr:carboxypeptidase-like regulatory domain-containing protein [Planctomycetota bacterium]